MDKTLQNFENYIRKGRETIRRSDLNPGTKKRLERYLNSLTIAQYKYVTSFIETSKKFDEIERLRSG